MARLGKRWHVPRAIIAAAAVTAFLGATIQSASAYDRYSDGCQFCHGSFFDGTSPKGTVFPAGSKHEMHKNQAFIDASCDLCHGGPGNEADYLASSAGTDNNPGLGCVGCHGQPLPGGDSAPGLRSRHAFTGVSLCSTCHVNDPDPLPESTMPTYFGTPDTRADSPCNVAPAYGESFSLEDTIGLDNDGDGVFDLFDESCGVPEFETSLHVTRAGKNYWYGEENGGFEAFTNVPIEDIGCTQCHGPNDADGNPYDENYEPSCVDCHASDDWSVSQEQCLGCHGRQRMESQQLGYSDEHRDVGMVCWDCHTFSDMHGTGVAHNSMLEPEAIAVDCEDCHTFVPFGHEAYDPHDGALHCTACHAQTVISCYNCHFESQVDSHVKRAKQPLHNFVMLVNRDEDGKVYPATFQSLTYQGDAFAAFGPFTSHTITEHGRVCTDCHQNFGGDVEAIEEYNDTGEIKFAKWDDDADALSWIQGVVPIPEDYEETLKMDFITYDGATSDPPGPSTNWSSIGKDTWDGHQMFFCTPLTREQMNALGFAGGSPSETFPTSLHALRTGKNYWYGEENGGFEAFTQVPIEDIGCTECHGPTDADGNPYGPDYEPSCVDCHNTTDFGVAQEQCIGCHGRQRMESQQLGYSDVHRDAGMVCWDCHTSSDMHGDGTMYNSMLEPNAISADCEDCHQELPDGHGDYDPHGGALHCTTCHAQTVISCYNCHFESQVDSHVKRAKQPLHNFVMLVNREEDGKVYPATFQSLTYEGDAFAAFGPFTSHTITAEGRSCGECHLNFGGDVPAIQEYNDTGKIKFATWDDVDKTLTWLQGVVPIPADYETTLKMDFITYDGATSDPPGPSTNWSSIGKETWDGHQMFFATPLTPEQMEVLGFEEAVQCPEDLTGDGVVDSGDLFVLLGAWGESGVAADLTDDQIVDSGDLFVLLGAWGACPD